MPTITKDDHQVELTGTVDVDHDVSVDEFLSACDQGELDEVYDWLNEKGFIDKELNLPYDGSDSDNELNDSIEKISDARLQLTNEDLEDLKRIAGKYR